jgi:uncharacterized protein (TIGR03437 family)
MSTTGCLKMLTLAVTATIATPYSLDRVNSTRGETRIRVAAGSVLRYTFQKDFVPGNNIELVRDAFRRAGEAWMAAMPLQDGKPVVRFEEDTSATAVNTILCDRISMISFSDSTDTFATGQVARFSRRFTPAGFDHYACEGTGEDIFTPVGQINENDMIFNPTVKYSTSMQAASTYDIQALAVHVFGHWLGIGHTGIVGAAMAPACDFGLGCTRRLHSDDIAALWAIYGPPTPAISGTVSTTSGTPVKSAHVVATDAATGITTASAITDKDGAYRVAGLPPGNYRVFSEPLDGPVQMASLSSYYQDGNNNFATSFFAGEVTVSPAAPANISPGNAAAAASNAEATNVDIQVATPATANLQFIGTGNSASSLGTTIRRGVDTNVNLLGMSLTGNLSFSSPKITQRNPVRTSGTTQISDVRIASDAALGTTDVYFGTTSFTGGLVVTVNPVVAAGGIVDNAAFNRNTSPPHFAPGTVIAIFGQDLAGATATFDRAPLPTQLAGVSVQVGDRWAPLYFVSPNQIVAMIPFETSGSSVAVTVVAEGRTSSAATMLTLGASAPRILESNGQGAIRNASQNFVLADAGNPAKAGDALAIYCIGLGKVQGNLASGLAASGEPTLAQVQATIGGKPAQVLFAGLAPGFVGLFQVNALVPSGIPPGRAEVVLSTADGTSNRTSISVQ